ncbi:hypothetical protein QR680_016362 [Steinernema hermaphroditum]|uniref:Secreted protein n=1 Tax=Steinernema hermaphroditum TaxID=289476 RepID=A0AA39HD57_9BILA|nr:hypothetical protein QR680_016362 [Steinernema hermaphroditum]
MLSRLAYFCLLACLLTSIALVQEAAAQYGSFGNMLGFGNYGGGNSLGSFWLFCEKIRNKYVVHMTILLLFHRHTGASSLPVHHRPCLSHWVDTTRRIGIRGR